MIDLCATLLVVHYLSIVDAPYGEELCDLLAVCVKLGIVGESS